MEKLLTREEVENYPVGSVFTEVNRHKKGDYIEEIKVTLGMGAESWIGKLLYGIWNDFCKNAEVIGNIYDNPELLGGAK